MKKTCWISFLFAWMAISLIATSWSYDFGTGSGTFTSTTPSTSFLPTPISGIARVRIGDGGGSFNLQNPGLTSLGSATELRMQAPSNTSVNKYSIYDYIAGKTFFTKFDVLFGNSTAGNADSGTFYFTQGDGAMYSDNNAFWRNHVFSGIRWVWGTNGTITTTYRNGANWSLLGSAPFSQGTVYSVEIYGNNTTSSMSYDRNGTTYSVDDNKQDIWVSGILIGDDLAKGELVGDSIIDSFLFYSLSSTNRAANCFLDNIVYSNSLPTMPTTQASGLSIQTGGSTAKDISWTNGTGDKRVVLINSENSFTAPIDGTDPAANPDYSSRGQQVIYNGTGDMVTVSGLTPDTIYWIRIYECMGEGLTTVYNTGSAVSNPASFTDTDQTLPVELSNFMARINSLDSVQLTWATQSETNVYGFYVYRSVSGYLSDAVVISPMIGATNSSNQKVYVFYDTEITQDGLYYYWLQVQDLDGGIEYHGSISIFFNHVQQSGTPGIPLITGLSAIYPNPFNPSTTIQYQIEQNSEVLLNIYNARGQLVRSFKEGFRIPAAYAIIWNGTAENGSSCASGIYWVEMKCGLKRFIKKAVLMK